MVQYWGRLDLSAPVTGRNPTHKLGLCLGMIRQTRRIQFPWQKVTVSPGFVVSVQIRKRYVILGDVSGREHSHVLKGLRDQFTNNSGNKVEAMLGTEG